MILLQMKYIYIGNNIYRYARKNSEYDTAYPLKTSEN